MGADEPMMRLGDDRALGHFHHAFGFAQNHFHNLWVFLLYLGDLHSEGRWGHSMEIDQSPLGLGDNLLGHDQNIATGEGEILALRPLNDDLREIHSRCNVR